MARSNEFERNNAERAPLSRGAVRHSRSCGAGPKSARHNSGQSGNGAGELAAAPRLLSAQFHNPAGLPDLPAGRVYSAILCCPADRRFDFAASDAGTKAVEELVKAHPVAKMLPPQALPQLTTMLRDGLLSHLRSIPLGMRVDRWLAAEFPDLIPLQKQSILRQLEDSAVTLAPQHRQTAPKLIFDATESISAAFAALGETFESAAGGVAVQVGGLLAFGGDFARYLGEYA